MIKVVHISNGDSGGAGIAAVRLSQALRDFGIDSKILSLSKTTGSQDVIQYQVPLFSKLLSHSPIPWGQNRYKHQMAKIGNASYEAVSFPKAYFDISESKAIEEADIVTLHWVGSMLNYARFFRNVRKPIVWTLHDMNPFLGIAHYMGDREKNTAFAGIEREAADYKCRSIAQHDNVHVVNLCDWMKSYSAQSKVFANRSHSIIANSINVQVFKPYDKKLCRELLGLPMDRPIILLCAQYIQVKRKGFDLLLDAMTYIRHDCFFAVAGVVDTRLFPDTVEYKAFGTIKDERLLAFLYAAADVFVLPSREDNLPNTMLESLSCGTPVVAFNNGGMRDVLSLGHLGVLVEEQRPQVLADAINELLTQLPRYSQTTISSTAHEMFCPEKQAREYIQLYNSILN
jgi:glycosyltransferase involved in cell wall biosynthesis